MMPRVIGLLTMVAILVLSAVVPAQTPMDTAFTYQGLLKQSGSPINGHCDFLFALYGVSSGGSPIAGVFGVPNLNVANGLFTANLDFGSVFQGQALWLQVQSRCPAATGSYITLSPRQALTATPYALTALTALTALKTAYKNVLVVAKSGGHYNSIQAALNSIGDASVINPYLVYVAPGIYNERVTMKRHVDIEGAGELATKITYAGSDATIGTVSGVSDAELRFLTVENTGGFTLAIAIRNLSDSPRLTHITVTASGGSFRNCGVLNDNSSSPTMTNVNVTASGGSESYGVFDRTDCSPTMANVTVTASGASTRNYGVYNEGSSTRIQNSTIDAIGDVGNRYGIYNIAASGSYTVTVNNSQITGATNTIHNDFYFTTRIGTSKLDGGAAASGGGTLKCAGVYDENYVFYPSSCPP